MKNNFKTGKKTGRVLVALTMAAAMTVPVIGNVLLSRSSLSVEAATYTSAYDTKKALYDAQHALNQKIVEEGTVLLKNKNNALPLAGNDKKVTVFHSFHNPEDWSQSEGAMVLSGGGSGNIWVNPPAAEKCEGTAAYHGCHTLYNGLTDHGYTWNPVLHDEVYFEKNAWNEARPTNFCDANGPKLNLVKAKESSFAEYNGTAIITISRIETESQDNYEPYMGGLGIDEKEYNRDPAHPEQHYLQLRDREKELITYAKTKFGKVVVLLNTAATMEVEWLQTSDDVDAVLWIGYPGESGLKDIPGVLDGTVSPSGRTVDTWVTDMSKDPTWQNFGDNSQNDENFTGHNTVLDKEGNVYYLDPDLADDPDWKDENTYHSVDYAENIYLGYRYYETKATIMNEETAGSGDTWYAANVTYPFGYGLSYTTFKQEIIGTPTTSGDTISFNVKITNDGSVAGKEVVQVYYNPPYTAGGIEKATANLVAFEKTDVIEAGATQTITITFDKRQMASWSLAAGNYVLEDGKYEISINKNSHDKWDSIDYNHASDTVYTEDETTGTAYSKLFSGNDMYNVDKSKYTADGTGVNFMSRANGLQLPETAGDVKFSDEAIAYLNAQNTYVSTQDKSTDPWVVDANIPADWTQRASATSDPTDIQLAEMIGVPLDDVKWVSFMNQLTWDEMKNLVSTGLYNSAALERAGKPRTNDTDGPAQIGATAGGRGFGWCAAVNISSTWNTDLAEQYGEMVGEEANHPSTNGGALITGWYGPGMNIHRNPYGGRNFEYYSEDGLLAGKIAAGAVKGAASKGLITYLKHLALNNQETNRTTNGGVCTWTNEQAMREIYLKPFELAVKEGGATGMMCSFNRIGGVPAGSNYNLFVNLLEKEWGFDGIAVTDYYKGSSWGWPGNMVVRCHMFPMGNYSEESKDSRKIDGTWDADKNRPVVNDEAQDALYYAVRTTAQRMLKAVANSNAVNPEQIFPDQTYTVIQGLGVGFINFGAFINESGGDKLEIVGHEGENQGFEIAPGYTFYCPSGNSLGTFVEAGTYSNDIKVTYGDDKWGENKGYTYTSNLTINVLPAFQIDEKTLSGNVGSLFSTKIEFVDYDKEYVISYGGFTYKSSGIDRTKQWTDVEGLPEGLELLPSGVITGVPEEEGTFEVTAKYNGNLVFRFTLEIGESIVVRTEFKTEDGKLWYKHSDQDDTAWQVVIDLDEFKGADGADGTNGSNGTDGVTPTISISEDGYWVINGEKTNVKAAAESGGCNGSVDVLSVALTSTVFLIAGAVIFIVRRKRKN